MKKLKNLKGAKMLNKVEQQSVKGGKRMCLWREGEYYCPPPYVCLNGICVLSPI